MTVLIVGIAAALFSAQAAANTVGLSNVSSDPLIFAPEDMSATLSFSVSGSTLALDVTNLAATPTETLFLTEFFFNATDTVTSLTLTSAPVHSATGEALWELNTNFVADGFGMFDFNVAGLRVGNGQSREDGEILSGQTTSFEFLIGGAGEFGTELSLRFLPAEHEAFAAGKFVGDASEAFGGAASATPEPTTFTLLAAGLLGLAVAARRRRPSTTDRR